VRVAVAEPLVRSERLHVVDVEIVRTLGLLDQHQRFRGEAKFVKMVPGDPFPNDVAFWCDFVDHVVELLGQREAGDLIAQDRQDQRVAVGKASPIVVLLRRSARRGLAPLPHDLAIPIELTDGLVLKQGGQAGDHAGLAAGHVGELDHDMPARTADQRWVEHVAREAAMIPAVHLVAVHIDKVRLIVGAAEQDKDVIRLARIVTRYAGGIDARCGRDGRRPQHGAKKTHSDRDIGSLLHVFSSCNAHYTASRISPVNLTAPHRPS